MNLSQETLAGKVGYSDKTAIAKIEAGKVDLPQSKIIAFATALNTTTSYLLDGDDAYDEPQYYYDKKVQELTDEMMHKPNLQMLCDASRNLSADDMQMVIDMVNRMNK